MSKKVLAIDLGGSGGRAVIGELKEDKIVLTEIHRFSNDPVKVGNTMYWDVLRLFHEIKQSLIKSKAYGELSSIAVDTWGVDFGLLDKEGRLLENPVHYRDARTAGMIEESSHFIDKDQLYEMTGNQLMEINTVFQLLSLMKHNPELLQRTDNILLMPDLFHYFLCGEKKAEQSIASTTQMFDIRNKCWSKEILDAFKLGSNMLPEIVKSGTIIGQLSTKLCEELDIKPLKVIAVCGHDTQSALAACPAKEKDFLFLSSGTWSLLGTECETPVIDKKSFAFNMTNELGYDERTSFLKNITGLWLIQESRRQWIREGKEYSFSQLEQMARAEKPLRCFINPDAAEFTPSGNIPKRIQQYCQKTGQYVPQTAGEITRCIYESLALKYRMAKEEVEACTGKKFQKLYIIGGGTQARLLSQLTADSCACEVSSGPVEATSFGNIAIQLITLGEIEHLEQARSIISNSEEIDVFVPGNQEDWEHAFQSFKDVCQCQPV